MRDKEIELLRAVIATLEGQRGNLGDAVLELGTAPLRARLASLLRPAGVQRRQVTVLFADLVASTALAQGLGAEETLDVLSGALRRMAAIIKAHQGRVLRFTGDGVKAAFGMDVAMEDDAERAVRAGLAILAAAREQAADALRLHGVADFAVRVGVHTGDVAQGAGVEADNTAMGVAADFRVTRPAEFGVTPGTPCTALICTGLAVHGEGQPNDGAGNARGSDKSRREHHGDADDFLATWRVVHVFIRRPASSRTAFDECRHAVSAAPIR